MTAGFYQHLSISNLLISPKKNLSPGSCWPLAPPPPHSYLFLFASFGHGAVQGLVEEDFLHLPVLKVVQLADSILGAGDQVHHGCDGTLSA